jgi:hypothetical protein
MSWTTRVALVGALLWALVFAGVASASTAGPGKGIELPQGDGIYTLQGTWTNSATGTHGAYTGTLNNSGDYRICVTPLPCSLTPPELQHCNCQHRRDHLQRAGGELPVLHRSVWAREHVSRQLRLFRPERPVRPQRVSASHQLRTRDCHWQPFRYLYGGWSIRRFSRSVQLFAEPLADPPQSGPVLRGPWAVHRSSRWQHTYSSAASTRRPRGTRPRAPRAGPCTRRLREPLQRSDTR